MFKIPNLKLTLHSKHHKRKKSFRLQRRYHLKSKITTSFPVETSFSQVNFLLPLDRYNHFQIKYYRI